MKKLFAMFPCLFLLLFPLSACATEKPQEAQTTTIEVTLDNYEYYLTKRSYVINDSIDSRLGKVVGCEFTGAVNGIYDVTVYWQTTFVVTEQHELHLNAAGYGTLSYLTTRNFKIVNVTGTIIVDNYWVN